MFREWVTRLVMFNIGRKKVSWYYCPRILILWMYVPLSLGPLYYAVRGISEEAAVCRNKISNSFTYQQIILLCLQGRKVLTIILSLSDFPSIVRMSSNAARRQFTIIFYSTAFFISARKTLKFKPPNDDGHP